MTDAFENSNVAPLYIRAVQGHSGFHKVKIHQMGTWEVCEKHTLTLWHAGWRHNMDSILRNGLIAGGTGGKPSRRQHCYFSIVDPRKAKDPRMARGRPERGDESEAEAQGVSTTPYRVHSDLDAGPENSVYISIRLRLTRSYAMKTFRWSASPR